MQRLGAAVSQVKENVNEKYTKVKQIPQRASDELERVTDIARLVALRTLIVVLTVAILILASVFIYGSFYFAFVPAPAHRAPLFLGFEPCENSPTKCGFMNASVHFNVLEGGAQMSRTPSGSAVLMAGQAYTVMVALRMPESPKNTDLGMFMSCLQMKSESASAAGPVKSSCKSSMMNFRSDLLRAMGTVSLAPFLMSGRIVEQQTVFIEFFHDFSDNPLNPVVSADFEIKSRFAEIYDAELIIHAKFSGLRYFMFYYPLTSAVIGSSLNLAILSLVVALSWFRFFRPTPSEDEIDVRSTTTSGTGDMTELYEDVTAPGQSENYNSRLDEYNEPESEQQRRRMGDDEIHRRVEDIEDTSSDTTNDSICVVDEKPQAQKKME